MSKIKVIVADIDETLVAKYQDVSDYEKRIIESARAEGILFGIASGRPLYHCKDLISNWGLKVDFLICNNGSNLYDFQTRREYDYDFLKPEWCKEIIDLMIPYHPNVMMYWNETNYVSKQDDMVLKAGNKYHYKYKIESDIRVFYKNIEKLMFRLDENMMDEAEAAIKKHPSPYYVGFRTQPIMLEFNAKNVSKGNTLKKYCEMHNIPLSSVCAMGDTENDEDMLKVSGLGVCMSNGSESTKKIANAVTEYDCYHDGCGRFIEDHILGKKLSDIKN